MSRSLKREDQRVGEVLATRIAGLFPLRSGVACLASKPAPTRSAHVLGLWERPKACSR